MNYFQDEIAGTPSRSGGWGIVTTAVIAAGIAVGITLTSKWWDPAGDENKTFIAAIEGNREQLSDLRGNLGVLSTQFDSIATTQLTTADLDRVEDRVTYLLSQMTSAVEVSAVNRKAIAEVTHTLIEYTNRLEAVETNLKQEAAVQDRLARLEEGFDDVNSHVSSLLSDGGSDLPLAPRVVRLERQLVAVRAELTKSIEALQSASNELRDKIEKLLDNPGGGDGPQARSREDSGPADSGPADSGPADSGTDAADRYASADSDDCYSDSDTDTDDRYASADSGK